MVTIISGRRRLLLPAFQGERMLAYTGAVRSATEKIIHAWQPDTSFSVHAPLQKLALEAVLQSIFGEEPKSRSCNSWTRERCGELEVATDATVPNQPGSLQPLGS